MPVRRPVTEVVLAALAAATLAGCGAGSAESDPRTSPPDGLRVSLVQQRSDVAERQAQVRIRNDGGERLTIGAVEVSARGFDGAGVRVVDRVSTLPAGAAVDVRVQLPPMDCAASPLGAPVVTIELGSGGAARTVTVEAADTLEFLPALHARECLGAALARVAAVTIAGFTPAAAGATGTLTLAIAPTGTGTASLHAVDSTTLFTFVDGSPAGPLALGVEIRADSEPTALDVPLVPQRCDPHVVQEDKRGTIFTVDVTVDGVDGDVDLVAPPEMKARMLTWVAEWCGFGSG
jgi:hypothetical protein